MKTRTALALMLALMALCAPALAQDSIPIEAATAQPAAPQNCRCTGGTPKSLPDADAQPIYPADPALLLGHACSACPIDRDPATIILVEITSDAHVRAEPGPLGTSLGIAAKGDELVYAGSSTRDERGKRWHKVQYKTGTGWISAARAAFTDARD